MSTAQDEQLLSYENQLRYYKDYIENNSKYEFAGIYADEGISATGTKNRDDFKRMIADCRLGKNRQNHYKINITFCKKYP